MSNGHDEEATWPMVERRKEERRRSDFALDTTTSPLRHLYGVVAIAMGVVVAVALTVALMAWTYTHEAVDGLEARQAGSVCSIARAVEPQDVALKATLARICAQAQDAAGTGP